MRRSSAVRFTGARWVSWWTATLAILATGAMTTFGVVQAGAAAGGDVVSSWVTTSDRSELMAARPALTFGSGPATSADVITVDPSRTYQTIDGFGASITDSSARLLSALPADQRAAAMRSLFSPTAGIGMSMLRQPIGSSDFVDGPHYTFDDLPAGQTDYPMARFSVAHDQAQILPLLREAISLNPALKVIASPWGQPAWMKSNRSTIGGQLIDTAAVRQAYGLYLLRFVQAYKSAGVPIYALSVQNEPQNRTPDGYPGTDMPVATEAAVIDELGPMLRDAGLGAVKIIAYDHNWAEHPDDIADAARLGVPAEPNYPYDVLRTTAAQWIAGVGYHCYSGDVSAQSAFEAAFPQKGIWMTECSGWHGVNDSPAQIFADTLRYHADTVMIGSTRNWAKSVTTWNVALDSQGGPVNGGCGNNPQGMCTGVLTIDGTAVTQNAEYYTLGHLSRFVSPGAVRVASNNSGDIHTVCFRNPDGSMVLVATNAGGGSKTFGVSAGGQSLPYILPAGALATLMWHPGGSAVDVVSPSAPGTLTGSSTTSASTTLSWTASTDNVGVTGYRIYRDALQVGATAATTFTASGLTPSTTYRFTVRAGDAAGNLSADSSAAVIRTAADPAGQSIDPGAWYQVVNTNSGKCLDDAAWAIDNGAALQQWSCSAPTADNQLWQFHPTSSGYYQVTSRHAPAMGWDVTDAAVTNGSQIQLWQFVGGTNQQWKPVASVDGRYQFVARHSGKCLDVTDVSTTDGARLQQWSCYGGSAQTFALAKN